MKSCVNLLNLSADFFNFKAFDLNSDFFLRRELRDSMMSSVLLKGLFSSVPAFKVLPERNTVGKYVASLLKMFLPPVD
jgi:hypothetical protein